MTVPICWHCIVYSSSAEKVRINEVGKKKVEVNEGSKYSLQVSAPGCYLSGTSKQIGARATLLKVELRDHNAARCEFEHSIASGMLSRGR